MWSEILRWPVGNPHGWCRFAGRYTGTETFPPDNKTASFWAGHRSKSENRGRCKWPAAYLFCEQPGGSKHFPWEYDSESAETDVPASAVLTDGRRWDCPGGMGCGQNQSDDGQFLCRQDDDYHLRRRECGNSPRNALQIPWIEEYAHYSFQTGERNHWRW